MYKSERYTLSVLISPNERNKDNVIFKRIAFTYLFHGLQCASLYQTLMISELYRTHYLFNVSIDVNSVIGENIKKFIKDKLLIEKIEKSYPYSSTDKKKQQPVSKTYDKLDILMKEQIIYKCRNRKQFNNAIKCELISIFRYDPFEGEFLEPRSIMNDFTKTFKKNFMDFLDVVERPPFSIKPLPNYISVEEWKQKDFHAFKDLIDNKLTRTYSIIIDVVENKLVLLMVVFDGMADIKVKCCVNKDKLKEKHAKK